MVFSCVPIAKVLVWVWGWQKLSSFLWFKCTRFSQSAFLWWIIFPAWLNFCWKIFHKLPMNHQNEMLILLPCCLTYRLNIASQMRTGVLIHIKGFVSTHNIYYQCFIPLFKMVTLHAGQLTRWCSGERCRFLSGLWSLSRVCFFRLL